MARTTIAISQPLQRWVDRGRTDRVAVAYQQVMAVVHRSERHGIVIVQRQGHQCRRHEVTDGSIQLGWSAEAPLVDQPVAALGEKPLGPRLDAVKGTADPDDALTVRRDWDKLVTRTPVLRWKNRLLCEKPFGGESGALRSDALGSK